MAAKAILMLVGDHETLPSTLVIPAAGRPNTSG